MCEPLRGKKSIDFSRQEYFEYEDVKSAVKGFLKEIDCMKKGECTIIRCDVEQLVAKWFADVI